MKSLYIFATAVITLTLAACSSGGGGNGCDNGDILHSGAGGAARQSFENGNTTGTLVLASSALDTGAECPLAGVSTHGDKAYVGGMSTGYVTTANVGVRIVDLSDPTSPQLVGRIPLRTLGTFQNHSHGDAVATHISSDTFEGDVAMVLLGVPDNFDPTSYPAPHGLWDVTDPGNPTFLSVLNLGNAPHGNEGGDLGDKPYDAMAAAGNYFYTLYDKGTRSAPRNKTDADTRLAVVDVSDPTNPVVVGDWQDNSEVWLMGLSINESATRAYITGLWPPPYHFESTHGYLYILDIDDPSGPTELGRYVFPLVGTPSSVSIARPTSDDALVVLADHSWGVGDSANEKCGILHVLDTSNPAAIQEISTFELPESSSPSRCSGRGNWIIATDVAIRGDVVYSTWLKGGVRAIDISDPANPVEIGSFVTDNHLSDIDLLGDDYVVATSVWDDGMAILKAVNP